MRRDISRGKQVARMNRAAVCGIAIPTLALLVFVWLIPDPIRAEAAIQGHSVMVACDAGQISLVGRPAQPVWGDDDDEDGEDYEGSGRPDID